MARASASVQVGEHDQAVGQGLESHEILRVVAEDDDVEHGADPGAGHLLDDPEEGLAGDLPLRRHSDLVRPHAGRGLQPAAHVVPTQARQPQGGSELTSQLGLAAPRLAGHEDEPRTILREGSGGHPDSRSGAWAGEEGGGRLVCWSRGRWPPPEAAGLVVAGRASGAIGCRRGRG